MKKKLLLLLIGVLFITGCGEKKERVVIYTSMEEVRNQELKKQVKEEFPKLDVIVQYLATGNSAAKIKNEGNKVEADIVIDLETAHMENLKENFADLSDFDSSIFVDESIKDNNYFPWAKQTTTLVIDKKYFKDNSLEIPKKYEDLL